VQGSFARFLQGFFARVFCKVFCKAFLQDCARVLQGLFVFSKKKIQGFFVFSNFASFFARLFRLPQARFFAKSFSKLGSDQILEANFYKKYKATALNPGGIRPHDP
jgi:hypothetical protein